MCLKILLCFLSFMLLFSGCSTRQTITPESINKRGVLKVGIKEDVPGFGYYNKDTGQYEGLEIDLAKLMAREFTGDEKNLELVPVTTSTRGPLLDNGDIDIALATFAITEERKLQWNFSAAYYTDYIGFMVKKDSGIVNLEKLKGKTVGVVKLSPTRRLLEKNIQDSNFDFKEYDSLAEAKIALDLGIIDGLSIASSLLAGYLDDSDLILSERYVPTLIGAAVKLTNKVLSQNVNNLIEIWLNDGTIDRLIQKNNI